MKILNIILLILCIANAFVALLLNDNYHAFLGWFVAALLALTYRKQAN